MSLLTLRLTEKLEQGLNREVTRSKRSRSVLVRQALAEFLTKRARERELNKFKKAADAIAAQSLDPDFDDFRQLSNQALTVAEENIPDYSQPDEKWWK